MDNEPSERDRLIRQLHTAGSLDDPPPELDHWPSLYVAAKGPARIFARDDGREIEYVRWCDTETGEYEQYVTDEQGLFVVEVDDQGLPYIVSRFGVCHGGLRVEPMLQTPEPQAREQ